MQKNFTILIFAMFFVFNNFCFINTSNAKTFDKQKKTLEDTSNSYEAEKSKDSSDEEMKDIDAKINNILKMVKEGYYNEISAKQSFEYLARGFLNNIDPYSTYLTEEEFISLKSMMMGKFGGIGVEITKERGFIKIISPIEDSPGYKAGLKSGDFIIKIEDKTTYEKSTYEILKMLRGDPGSSVKLTILREGLTKPFDISIKRDIVNIVPVKYETLGNNIFYVKITTFTENTYEEFLNAMRNAPKDISAMILDLRYNPGGEIEQCIMIADLFLPQDKTIVSVKGRNKAFFTVDKNNFEKFDNINFKPSNIKIINNDNEIIFKSTKNSIIANNISLVVLVNAGSASASEILTAALQQNQRAIIVGEKTFGKGSVQSIIPLDNGKDGAIKMTIAKYYTPNGTSINDIGILPDIIEPEINNQSDNQSMPTQEKQINNNIASENKTKEVNLIQNNKSDTGNPDTNISSLINMQILSEQQKSRPDLTPQAYARLKQDNQLWTAYTLSLIHISQGIVR